MSKGAEFVASDTGGGVDLKVYIDDNVYVLPFVNGIRENTLVEVLRYYADSVERAAFPETDQSAGGE